MNSQSDRIRDFLLDHVEAHPRDISRLAAEEFGITRQAVNRHLKLLIEAEAIEAHGATNRRVYSLKSTSRRFTIPLEEHSEEDQVWRVVIDPFVKDLPRNVRGILYYAFTEMFNNAIDHSGGKIAVVTLKTNARWIQITIADDGVGIFEKIRAKLGLSDPREAILELAKGKFTTDPERHSGQGIFFTSRMCDRFAIRSGHLLFGHDPGSDEDWLIEVEATAKPGTMVSFDVRANTPRTDKEIFDQYTDLDSEDYSFSKTHVPVSLARYDVEQLVSRSQAKRVLSRFDRFKEVVLDFRGVESIGQAFADEIFRVFRTSHPEIKIVAIFANESVQRMINRAQSSDPRGLA